MLCILSPVNKPEFNLAAEEYLFKNFTEDVFFLYVNSPSVVVGKHQNALAEVNPAFIRENKIPVIRRLSGGGAVYHDLGNLNFSFHQTVADPAKVSFKQFNEPIVAVLQQLNVPAEISSRNDILVNGFKVSGHADHVFRNRVLSHGTLLFNANREHLSLALRNESGTYTGKAIQSVRSKVCNVSDFIASHMSLAEFTEVVQEHVLKLSDDSEIYKFTATDIERIEELMNEKYTQWEWNFAYSPKYQFTKSVASPECSISINVEKGLITNAEIKSFEIHQEQLSLLCLNLQNCRHEFKAVFTTLRSMKLEQLIECFF